MTGHDEHPDLGPDGFDAPEPLVGDRVAALLADADVWEQPPDGLGDRIVAAVRSETVVVPLTPRSARGGWVRPAVLGAAAVVVLLFVGIVALSAVDGPGGSDRFAGELVPTGLIDGVDGSITMTSFDSGLRIELDAPNLPRRDGGQFYEAWVRTADGMTVPCGTFHGGEDVVLWAGVDRRDVTAFSVTMEQVEDADSAEHRSSGRVVLKSDIPAP